MKRIIPFTLAFSIILIAIHQEEDAYVKEAREIIKEFFSQLGGELKTSMQEGGPSNAIEVCKIKAPEIANLLSEKYDWNIKRKSLKPRNPDNTANNWERIILQQFEERRDNGENAENLEHFEFIEEDGKKYFRYIKAIPTSALCLTCHGENISDKIQTKLDELYPDDKAVGFQLADLRGAFSLIKAIE